MDQSEIVRAFLASKPLEEIEPASPWRVKHRLPKVVRREPPRVSPPPIEHGELSYYLSCLWRDVREVPWYWDALIRHGTEGLTNALIVEAPLSFLYLKCKLTRTHVAVDAPSKLPEKRYCANCFKPMPNAPTGFWDRVTRTYRY